MLKEAIINLKKIISNKDVSFLVLMFSVFLLPLSINLSTFTFILSSVLKFVQVLANRNKLFETKALKNSAIIGGIFFSYIIISSVLQTNVINTLSLFEKDYMHFALFFITPMLLRSKKENKLLIYMFFVGAFFALAYVFLFSIINGTTFDKYAFVNLLDIHHTYLSMYLLAFVNFAIVSIITRKQTIDKHLKIILIVLIAVCLGTMFILGSKVSMLIFILLFIAHSLPELSRKNAAIYIVTLIILLSIMQIFNNQINVSYKKALDFRLQVWEVSFDIFENNPIFGNLILSEKDILNYKHYINGKYYFLDSDLNSHNQYLSILMRFGLFGFFILFAYAINIFRSISKKTNKKDLRESIGFFIIIFSVCYIENILDRHHGIVYLTFFYNYYLVEIENA
ncbi:MAG: hypothetical protein CMP05_03530 [Xanthomarina sp.]|uniref:O-antigen ligase family protein n=1 Tax=Xanthomarina TaxID=1868329 RepID=UPI000C3F952D|nr:O-antigen ligase family protein [Xanthomarina sp.]MDX1316121.1 O-antigen ligase family protein [Xanthomarina gelatinilytica]MAL22509.1 hypothetical protein [Xanthomarina sp.]MBF61051.1 hypothetical protein [Xanthomarina sp.]HAB27368.1 hypothetical protein [Xanthomarina gelatinilytica]HAI19666.1 hypothetical protein [Xanthomarina gelatinilytica]|tara:strand:+ start:30 stop:1217 length:1188 start_codon:yes stop_codon:yes gene_type:complete